MEPVRRRGLAVLSAGAATGPGVRRRLMAVALIIVALAGIGRTHRAQAPDRHVVLVSVDGFAAYHMANPAVDLPNIRALANAGVRAESSEAAFPSLTHPSHTTLVTGVTPRRHGIVGNRVRDRRTGKRFHITNLPRRTSVHVPTLFDVVHATGWRTAAFFWPETKDDDAIDDNVAEVFTGAEEAADPSGVSPGLLAELRSAGVSIDSYYAFYDDPFTQGAADVALTRAAAYVFGRRTPALMAIHLLAPDKVQHAMGPTHYASATAMTTADYCVGLLRQAVADAGLTDTTTFVIAADHGFVTAPFEMNVAPLLQEPALEGHVVWRTDGWYAFAELGPDFDPAKHGEIFERVLARAAGAPGIARVIGPGGFEALGYPEYAANPYVPGQYIVVADIDTRLVFDPASQDMRRHRRDRPYHGHGYLPGHPSMYPALVFSGAGVAHGRMMGHVRNVDVAPTIAALLGLAMPDVEGRVLRDVLE